MGVVKSVVNIYRQSINGYSTSDCKCERKISSFLSVCRVAESKQTSTAAS